MNLDFKSEQGTINRFTPEKNGCIINTVWRPNSSSWPYGYENSYTNELIEKAKFLRLVFLIKMSKNGKEV